jgi:hypothetical protein
VFICSVKPLCKLKITMFFFYHELCKLGRKVAGCICFTLILGPILIVVGGVILANAGKYSRTDAIDSYNSAVSSWSSSGYTAFQKYAGTTLTFNSGTPFSAITVSVKLSTIGHCRREGFTSKPVPASPAALATPPLARLFDVLQSQSYILTH